MKKILFTILTAICLFSCTNSSYKIEGSVDNKELNGTTVFIKERINRVWITLDSTIIKDSKFRFNGIADSAKIAYLVYEFPTKNRLKQAFVLENGKLKVSIDTSGFMVFVGTAQNELLLVYQQTKNAFYKKSEAFHKLQNDNPKKREQLQVWERNENKLNLEEVRIDRNFATENINTLVGTFVFTNSFFSMSIAEKNAIINLMNYKTKRITRIQEIIKDIETEKKVAVGSQFIDFKLAGLTDDSIRLSDFVGKTDYVLVDFWASWCSSCIQSLPELKKMYNTFKGTRLEIIAVSLDDNKEAWSGAVDSHQLSWKHGSDLKGWNSKASRLYAVNSIPNTVLINNVGKIIGRNLSIDKIANYIDKKVEK
jgi:peroxiredoxin